MGSKITITVQPRLFFKDKFFATIGTKYFTACPAVGIGVDFGFY